ncbi:hypothetical protein CrV_gp028 [Cylindrospermopsis raciborskii virus RM-2018a]|nr:hypothetical protein CrV_gp028 [Cylindrospermopsis raciborskii virus RM-2018a]
MPLATASQILQDYSLEVLLLPLNTLGVSDRTTTSVTFTVTANADVGATSISITASTATNLKAGNVLSFKATGQAFRTQVVILEDKSIATTATSVNIAPLSRRISISGDNSATAAATASFIPGLLPLTGIQTLDLNNQETQVDTTHFLSGAGTETALVRVNRNYSVSGVALAADEALETVIKPVGALAGNLFNREIYAAATFSDGERLEGVAKIYALNFPANQNEVKKYSFTLAFQGRQFTWTQPYTAFA